MTDEAQLSTLYNLILTPGTRDWERQQLLTAKTEIESGASQKKAIEALLVNLRLLAWRDNLTPDLADFYGELTGAKTVARTPVKTSATEETATFAGGCFWCMVEPFETRPGINSVVSGYTGGHIDHPTYDQVLTGATGHVEAVEIKFDPSQFNYEDLVDLYWQISDPTDDNGQFLDRGQQYRPVIFFQNATQQAIAEASRQALVDSGTYPDPIVTRILPAQTFWPAENYHQQFYLKQPKRYKGIERSRNQLLKTGREKRFMSRLLK